MATEESAGKTEESVDNRCCQLCCYCPSDEISSSRHFLWMIFKQNAFITIGYFLLYLAFGMCVGFLGPTLEDLACYTQETVSTISWTFFAQTCCMVVGIFVGGLISKCEHRYRLLSPDFLLLLSVICLPVTLMVVSLSRRVDVLAVMMGIMGLAMGMIDCLANLQLIHIYDKAVAPFLQAMHFCYGIGALISPLLAESFLLNEDCSMLVINSTHTSDVPVDNGAALSLQEASQRTKVYQAFWIIAAIQIPIVIYMTIVVIKMGMRLKTVNPEFKRLINSESKPILEELNAKEKSKAENNKLLTQWQRYLSEFQGSYSITFTKALLLTAAACFMVFIYDGLQGHVNQFVQTYAVKIVENDKLAERGGILNVSFWAAYSVGRLFSIVLAVKLTPYFMLLINIIGCQVAVFMFLSCIGGQSFIMIAVANIVLGLSMSSITPTTITMTEHFMDMTNLQMSLIIGGAALGEMIIPIIEGQLIDHEPTTFVTLLLVLVGLSWLVYAVFWLMGRVTQKYKAMASPSFIWYNAHQMDGSSTIPRDESVLAARNFTSDGPAHTSTTSLELDITGRSTDVKEKIEGCEKEETVSAVN